MGDNNFDQFYSIGHEYLYYVYLRRGYNLIPVGPANVTAKGFVSILQGTSGMTGRIAHRTPASGSTDFYWRTSSPIEWDQTWSSHYIRILTSPYNITLNQTITKTVSYEAPGSYNINARLSDTGQETSFNLTVELGNI